MYSKAAPPLPGLPIAAPGRRGLFPFPREVKKGTAPHKCSCQGPAPKRHMPRSINPTCRQPYGLQTPLPSRPQTRSQIMNSKHPSNKDYQAPNTNTHPGCLRSFYYKKIQNPKLIVMEWGRPRRQLQAWQGRPPTTPTKAPPPPACLSRLPAATHHIYLYIIYIKHRSGKAGRNMKSV